MSVKKNSSLLSILFLLLICALASACSTPSRVSSTRSRDFTDQRISRGGRIAVVTTSKLRNTFPSTSELAEAAIIESGLRKHGFTIQLLPPGADYGFMYAFGGKDYGMSGATVIGGHVAMHRSYVHRLVGQFYTLRSGGAPGQLLWEGNVFRSANAAPYSALKTSMLEELMECFPH